MEATVVVVVWPTLCCNCKSARERDRRMGTGNDREEEDEEEETTGAGAVHISTFGIAYISPAD